uniref:tetratricopeptide repeat protein n=1 Tax=Lachnoclostridium phocaeense TaxID=1871021 RepID=UPI0026DB2420|nr:tetratricopeptide repeat protein [Lachnoclostridium phocaeense]
MGEKRSKKTIVLLIICGVLLVAAVAAGILLIRRGLDQETYKEEIAAAEKYAASAQYEDAIVAYENAIEAVPEEDEAYLGLADVYLNQGKVSQAKATLEKGYTYSKAPTILDMLNGINDGSLLVNRFGQDQDKETMEQRRGQLGWNTAFLQRLENFTYSDYSDEYGAWPDIVKVAKGEVKVVHDDLSAALYYSDTPEDDTIVDDRRNRPDETGMPEKLELDSLDIIFDNFAAPVTLEQLQAVSSSTVEPVTDAERSYVQLRTGSVIMNIETDAAGTIQSVNAWNEVLLPEANQNRSTKGILSGIVIDAVTGEGVPEAELVFEGQEDASHTGEASTDRKGAFSVELDPDVYDVTITADGYVVENFEFEMEKDRNYSGEQFIISPELAAGTARIVLEWGSEPQDLDSYLIGDSDSGGSVFVSYYRKTASSGGETLAELDVDDTNGYGPETITLYDLNGVYQYTVVDYRLTSTLQDYGATVKVYLPGQAQPEVITVSPGAGIENIWEVFELDHGELNILNRAGDEDDLVEGSK